MPIGSKHLDVTGIEHYANALSIITWPLNYANLTTIRVWKKIALSCFFQSGISTSAERHLPILHRFYGHQARLPNDSASAALLPNDHPSSISSKVMSNSETNPVGALQERFQSRGVAPEFELIQSEGASHCPIFTYKVWCF